MIEPYRGRIYDPCCGSGGMFVQSEKFLEEHQGKISDLSIYGQEFNTTTWKLCKMNLSIRGLEGNIGQHHAYTFHNDVHKTLKADYSMLFLIIQLIISIILLILAIKYRKISESNWFTDILPFFIVAFIIIDRDFKDLNKLDYIIIIISIGVLILGISNVVLRIKKKLLEKGED
jgi:uncharacterized membrane protein YsdA (DUF1294 family)